MSTDTTELEPHDNLAAVRVFLADNGFEDRVAAIRWRPEPARLVR